MKNLSKFYKNKKVFITGHTGFKGSWLTSVLLKFGAKITGFSLNDEKRKNYENFINYKKIKNIYGNVCDYKKLKNEIKKSKPHIIFHLAAQPLVAESYINPLETFNTNFIGSVNIFEISKELNIKSIVVITSDKCYLNKEILRGYREQDELGGKDPYSASKASVEIAFQSYLQSFFYKKKNTGIATARAGNVIGGGDWSKNRIIPDCIKTIKKQKNLVIRNPLSTRPWQHVLEPISGYLILAKKLYETPKKFSGSWNFGPRNKETKNVYDVANIIIKNVYAKKSIKIIYQKANFKEANLLKLNSNKANKILKWSTKWSMPQALKKTAEWYDIYLRKKNTREVTNNQIKEYFF
jgi:CDP-glucose 4,6-dehydratase